MRVGRAWLWICATHSARLLLNVPAGDRSGWIGGHRNVRICELRSVVAFDGFALTTDCMHTIEILPEHMCRLLLLCCCCAVGAAAAISTTTTTADDHPSNLTPADVALSQSQLSPIYSAGPRFRALHPRTTPDSVVLCLCYDIERVESHPVETKWNNGRGLGESS